MSFGAGSDGENTGSDRCTIQGIWTSQIPMIDFSDLMLKTADSVHDWLRNQDAKTKL